MIADVLIRNGDDPRWATLIDWLCAADGSVQRHVTARYKMGGRSHTGYLTVTSTVGGEQPTKTVRVRDSSRSPRSQYLTPFDFDKLEIKVGARFRPAEDAVRT